MLCGIELKMDASLRSAWQIRRALLEKAKPGRAPLRPFEGEKVIVKKPRA
jgi:hypothetical protein